MTETPTGYALPADVQAAIARHDAERQEAVRAEMVRRVELATRVVGDVKAEALTLEMCAADPRVLFNDWLWTYDPRNVNKGLPTSVPFTLRPRQEDFIGWLQEREATRTSGMAEKSRDEGASFLLTGYDLHHWLFVEGFAGVLGSRKQDLVDKLGDPKTLLWKFRFMLYGLPAFFLRGCAPSFVRKQHDNFLRIENPDNGASITGEAGENMGRGGRASLYGIDEWAHVSGQADVNAAVSQNSDVRIKIFTPNGVGDLAYQERFSGRYPVFTFDWRDNPDKNYTLTREPDEPGAAPVTVHPWYEKQKAELDDVTLAQEVDIDYTASAEGVVIPAKWVQAAVAIRLRAAGPSVSAADLSEGGTDKTVYANRRGPVVRRVLTVPSGADWQQAAELERLAREDEAVRFVYDRLGIGAGITATLAQKPGLPFRVEGVANSDRPTSRVFEDQPALVRTGDGPGQKPLTNAERFDNLAAEMWWGLRLRFKRTHERHLFEQGEPDGKMHPDEDCIQIPPDPTVQAQLSQPTYSKNSRDKIVVDKRGNGTASPDHAEAVLYGFAPEAPPPAPRPASHLSAYASRR